MQMYLPESSFVPDSLLHVMVKFEWLTSKIDVVSKINLWFQHFLKKINLKINLHFRSFVPWPDIVVSSFFKIRPPFVTLSRDSGLLILHWRWISPPLGIEKSYFGFISSTNLGMTGPKWNKWICKFYDKID